MNDKVILEKKHLLLSGFCHVERYDLKYKLFNDQWTASHAKTLIIKPRAIAALPYDPILDKVVLIEQFRVGAFAAAKADPWLIEIVAGLADKQNESDEELVRREVLEETGLEVLSLLPIYNYFVSPAYSTGEIALFCARIDSSKAAKFAGLASEHEDIKTRTVTSSEAFEYVRCGKINNAITIIALQWLELNINKVRKKFSDTNDLPTDQ